MLRFIFGISSTMKSSGICLILYMALKLKQRFLNFYACLQAMKPYLLALALIASAPEAPLDELAKKDIDVIGAYEGLQRRHFDETRLMITSVFGGMKTITHEIVAKDGKILELTNYRNTAENDQYIIIDYANNGEYLRIKNIWIPTSKFCSNSKESKPRNVMCIISGKKHSDKRIANLFYVIDGGELNDDMEFRFD